MPDDLVDRGVRDWKQGGLKRRRGFGNLCLKSLGESGGEGWSVGDVEVWGVAEGEAVGLGGEGVDDVEVVGGERDGGEEGREEGLGIGREGGAN